MPLVDHRQLHEHHQGVQQVIEVVVTVVEVVELGSVQVDIATEGQGGFFVVVVVMNQVLENLHTDDGKNIVKHLQNKERNRMFSLIIQSTLSINT